jgi:hypothetical protein
VSQLQPGAHHATEGMRARSADETSSPRGDSMPGAAGRSTAGTGRGSEQGERSIATGARSTGRGDPLRDALAVARDALAALSERQVFWVFVGIALAVYVLSNPERKNQYNHFVWQADAFLHGQLWIRWPVTEGNPVNAYFQDIFRDGAHPGQALLPFAPLPAMLLLPFVAVFGLTTNAALLAAALGALNVGLAWLVTSRLTGDRVIAVLATIFYGFGTVAWYAAMLGSTWFLSHVVASTFLLLSLRVALDGERLDAARLRAAGRVATIRDRPSVASLQLARDVAIVRGRAQETFAVIRRHIEPVQFVAGLLLGIAALAREEVLLAAPFFVLVGAGGSMARRALSAGLGAGIMLAFLILYNLAASGQLLNPVYEHLYRTEYVPRPELRHADWNRLDPRYVPQNAVIMLAWPPVIRPECGLQLRDRDCPLLKPDPIGMSLLLTSPAYLLALPLVRVAWRRRIVLGSMLAVVAIAALLLAHFSQGWVQFGYRFSNSFAPFALILVTLGMARAGVRPVTVGLVAASVIINAWGVWWGVTLGW